MAAGHDEYWTKTMRDAWEAARDAGVNLAFMGANDSYWQVGYEDGGRTLVGYKASPDPDPEPGQKTTQFRQMSPARPECELFGVQLQDDVLYHRNLDLVADSAVPRDPWFAGSGLSTGSVLSGLGGSETDAVMPGCHVPPVTRLFSASGPPLPNGTPVRQDTVRYTACSGAEVFSAGSLQFAWGLDDWRDAIYTGPGLPAVPPADPRLQAAMTRALADLVRSHVPSRGPPQVCVPSAGILATARWAAVGQQLNFSTAATDPYRQIASQRWTISLPGSSATTDQSGVEGPTVTTTARSGTARINLTVADRSGATAKKLLKLQVCPCPWGLAAAHRPATAMSADGYRRAATDPPQPLVRAKRARGRSPAHDVPDGRARPEDQAHPRRNHHRRLHIDTHPDPDGRRPDGGRCELVRCRTSLASAVRARSRIGKGAPQRGPASSDDVRRGLGPNPDPDLWSRPANPAARRCKRPGPDCCVVDRAQRSLTHSPHRRHAASDSNHRVRPAAPVPWRVHRHRVRLALPPTAADPPDRTLALGERMASPVSNCTCSIAAAAIVFR